MAIVLSHVHFCPACDELWTCVQWMCAHEDCDDLLCKACGQKKPQVEVVDWRFAIAEPARKDPLAVAPRLELRAFILDVGQRVTRILAGGGLISLKEPRDVGLTARSVDQLPH